MFKKLLILTILVLFSSSLIYGANCYSSATVESSASIKIVDSKDALIAIPSILSKVDNTINTTIKNNMSEKIWVKIDNGSINDEEKVAIAAGEQISAKINLVNSQVDNVSFHATWNNNAGEAKIMSSIK